MDGVYRAAVPRRTHEFGTQVGQNLQGVDTPLVKASSLESALSLTQRRVDEIHNVITELESKLDKLCRPMPAMQEKPDAPSPVASPVVNHINDMNAQLETARTRIAVILDTLDV